MSLKTISIGCPNGEDHLEQLLHQTSTASLSSKAPLLQQTSFHSVHYFCSQINITNDPSKVTCRNKEETTICHFKLDCFINNFSFGTRFTNELKRVPQLCYSNEKQKKTYQVACSLARTHARI